MIEAWHRAKDGQIIRREHSTLGVTRILKSECIAIPKTMVELTKESFFANDWEIEKEKKQLETHAFSPLNTDLPRVIYIPANIPMNTLIKITWEWEE